MTRNINPHFRESISSQRKAASGIQKNVMSLGKSLVKELGLEDRGDTLSTWMAHYIAQQILCVKESEGDAKSNAEKNCFDMILKLWSHRSTLPNGKRPFESFESLFRAIESFDPKNKHPRFFASLEDETTLKSTKGKKRGNKEREWIDVAKVVDKCARALIQYSFKQAAIHVLDSKTKKWLSESISKNSEESTAILRIILTGKEQSEKDKKLLQIQHQIEAIRSKIDMLNDFKEITDLIHRSLQADLQEQLAIKSISETGPQTKGDDTKSSSKTKPIPSGA